GQVIPCSSLHSTAEPGRPTTHTLSPSTQTPWKSQTARMSWGSLVSVKSQPPPSDLLCNTSPPWPTAKDLASRSWMPQTFRPPSWSTSALPKLSPRTVPSRFQAPASAPVLPSRKSPPSQDVQRGPLIGAQWRPPSVVRNRPVGY